MVVPSTAPEASPDATIVSASTANDSTQLEEHQGIQSWTLVQASLSFH